MNNENNEIKENDKVQKALPEEETIEKTENSDSVQAESAQAQSEPSMTLEEAQKEFIEEFAPDPIVIPKYDKEKEKLKMDKAKAKTKKQNTKKSRKRRRLIRKIVNVIRAVFLFVLLLAGMTAMLASVVVRTNTTQYAIKSAILNSEPERFVIGKIKHPEKLMLKESSDYASVADILKDNSVIPIAYEDIERAVKRSTYPSFVSDVSSRVLRHLVYGDKYQEVKVSDVTKLLYENATQIEFVTGQKLGESACNNLARYILKSPAMTELKAYSLAKQPAAQYTYITSVVFALPVLIALVILLIIVLVLTIVACGSFAHKMIGWAMMVAGVVVGAAGYLFKPMFSPESEFVKSVMNALVKSFNGSSLIYGVVAFVLGLIIVLVGSALSDDEEYEDDEDDDFIDEIAEAVNRD